MPQLKLRNKPEGDHKNCYVMKYHHTLLYHLKDSTKQSSQAFGPLVCYSSDVLVVSIINSIINRCFLVMARSLYNFL